MTIQFLRVTERRMISKRNCMLAVCSTVLCFYVITGPLSLFIDENRPPETNVKFLTFYSTDRWGIGNEMYALASTIGINSKIESQRIVCFDKNLKIRRIFNLTQFPKCSATYLKELNALTYHEASYAKYDPLVENLPSNHHIILDRFFQSWKYFDNENGFIKKIFMFNKIIDSTAEQILNQKLKDFRDTKCKNHCSDIVQVAVHVRRKNLDQKHLHDLGYTTAPLNYYKRAMDYFYKKYKDSTVVFVVSSDDMEWTKHNLLDLTDKTILIESNNPAVDMAVLSKCSHAIISVGTFGWWSAWLANGTTIYYENWPVKDTTLYESTHHADYFPSSWIPM